MIPIGYFCLRNTFKTHHFNLAFSKWRGRFSSGRVDVNIPFFSFNVKYFFSKVYFRNVAKATVIYHSTVWPECLQALDQLNTADPGSNSNSSEKRNGDGT